MKINPFGAVVPRRLVLAGLCATIVTGQLAAQAAASSSTATDDNDVVTLSPFTVSEESADRYRAVDAISAVRVRAPLIDTASSISVLTRDVIDDLIPSRIFDAVRYVAGVQDGRGMQFQDRMILRGFESNGQRTVDNFLQPSDADNIDEAVIERIEVTKGPNAILSPSGAPGGSINIITKSPLFTRRGSITALLGLWDAQKLTLDMGGPLGTGDRFGYRVVGAVQDSRRYWTEDARLRNKLIAPMFGWRISDRTQLTVKLVAAEHWIFREPLLVIDPRVNATTGDPILAPGLDPEGLNGIQDWSHVGTHTADLFTQLTTSFNEHWSLRAAANGRYYFEDSEQQFLSTPNLNNRYNPYTGDLTQDHIWAPVTPGGTDYAPTFSLFFNPNSVPVRGDIQATRRKTLNLQSDLVGNYHFGEISSQTVTGFAYARQTAYGRGRNGVMPNLDVARPVSIRPAYGSNFSFYNRNSFTNLQLYLNQRFGLLDDRLYLTGGILRFDTKTVGRNVLTGAAPSVLDDAKEMWSANLLGKIRDNISVYYSHSTNSSPVIANNVPLWRDGVQDEVGFKTEWFDRRLSINGAWFQIDQTNVTIPNPARQTDPTAPEQLVSDFGNDGWELEVMGSITKGLSAIATYSKLEMRDSLGRPVRGVADRTASLLLNYRFDDSSAAKGLSVYAGVNYSGRRAGDTPINFTPLGVVGKVSFFLRPHYATTLGGTYRMNNVVLRLNIDNVLNEKDYIMIAGGRVAGTGITTAPGTNVKLSTTFEF